MNVSEYIFNTLREDYGVRHVFTVVGGGSMYLNEALRKSDMKYVCMHHEQACAIAAEGYARVNQELAVVCVTTGPGSLNCLTGIMGQWTDSVPVLYISGQVDSRTINRLPSLRQLGDQEVDIISIVRPITKYAVALNNSEVIKHVLPVLVNKAVEGRKGPVWLDVPWDIQKSLLS